MGSRNPFKSAGYVLLWSSVIAAVSTALGFWLDHPARVLPAAIGAATIPVAFVSLCKVLWRMRKTRSAATDAMYSRQEQAVYNWMALIALLILAFMACLFPFVFNLLHVFNVK